MSVSQLPSGRWRAQTYNPASGKFESSAKILGLAESSFATEVKARRADAKAAEVLAERKESVLTLAEWASTWTSDPLYERPKESTNIHNRERIRAFVKEHGHLPLSVFDGEQGDAIVARWIAGGRNLGTVPVLKAMFNDAASAKAGRLVRANPFAGLKLSKGKGRAEETPPTEAEVQQMIDHAYAMTAQGFAAWLAVAAWSGMRPGELDALRWDSVDFQAGRIHVVEQWNVKTRSFELPKNGKKRVILMTPQAREVLVWRQNESTSRFCFTNSRDEHWTPSARSHHWDRIRVAMGWLEKDSRKALYLCSRHFCGWYLYNVLELPAEDVAIQLGHEDGGELVRLNYGHRDRARTLVRIERAFADRAAAERASNVWPLKLVEGEGA